MVIITPEVDMTGYDRIGCLHEMFVKQAERSSAAIAVVTADNEQITFSELNDMSDVLASMLQEEGVTINKIVGIMMERSLEYVVSVIGIHKAGGAYLPVEVSYPQQLLNSVLIDSKPAVICTKGNFLTCFKDSGIKCIDMENWKINYLQYKSKISSFVPVTTKLDDMAYAVYSSGTTGKPKGILCPHRGAVFSYTWRHRAYPYKPNDREACNVFFVWEMLRPLLQGMPLYIIPDDVIYDPPRLAEFIKTFEITRMLFTPSLMQAVLTFQDLDLKTAFKSFRQIIFCGEVVTTSLRDKLAGLLPWVQLLNLYSISECHDIATSDISNKFGEPRKFCSVGKIFPEVHVVVMDENKDVKKIGEPGEIYIGGPTLAIGYLNRPDLNAEKFIERPAHVDFKVGSKLYRTGDWGYVLSDGTLEICGRCDSAVRIRGYNVELQAVEKALLVLSEVNSCCVLPHGEEGDEKYLVAFIVPDNSIHNPSSVSGGQNEVSLTRTRSIRLKLKDRLPLYMIPAKYIYLEKLPILDASSKLDKKALLKLLQLNENNEIDYQGQKLTDTQLKVANIWAKILNIFSIDIQENFFHLGGHSLAASHLISEINEEFKTSLNVNAVFQHPTIMDLSHLLNGNNSDTTFNLNDEFKLHSTFLPNYNDLDNRLSSFWQSFKVNKKKFSCGNVLLTGATGFVGSHLLYELLINTQCFVYCIVREHEQSSTMERIIHSQKHYGLLIREDLINERVIIIKGDVSLLNLGLSEEMYTSLSYDIDFVIHASANVNLILPYHALCKDNVIGTKNIILFSLTNKIKYLNYIRCGNVAGGVYRPSWNPSDFILYMIQGVLLTETAPDIDWKIELTPVETVRKIIINLSQDLNSSVGRIFHIVNNKPLPCQELWRKMKEVGYNVKLEQYNHWLNRVSSNNDLQNLSHLLQNLAKNDKYYSNLSTFRKDNTDVYLMGNKLVYPEVNGELFKIYLKHLADLNLIPNPPSLGSTERSLKVVEGISGRVILITGGSSGIGASIGIELALSGAKVALIARRIDKLNAIKQFLVSNGVIDIITLQADIMNNNELTEAVKDVESKWGPIEVLINNAGCMYYQLMKNCDLYEWHHMVNINCIGSLNCLARVLTNMCKRKSGHIITITSDAGRKAFPGLAVYSGTKFFLEGLCSALRMELSDSNIKVTCIQPGDVHSELRRLTTDNEASEKYDFSKSITILQPSDIAKSVVYALSQPDYCAINEILIEPQQAPI
ncbi:uncharacterized protein LOC142327684 isoform X2 [Lycorma delicatula]|uniref:uncharacterized protein LOC142327684 isoform X2 n=1 Tax=Lycorma delicatula TaxID=130591 RepID=UPI003F50FB63